MATHSSILAWRIPWTEEPGRLQSKGSQRVGHDWMTNTCLSNLSIHLSPCLSSVIFLSLYIDLAYIYFYHLSTIGYPSFVYPHHILIWDFPGTLHGKQSVCNEGDRGLIPGLGRSPGGGHGSPLQYSCLENPIDRGAWWALQSLGWQRSDTVEQLTKAHVHTHTD